MQQIDRYSNWPCSANYCVFDGTMEFSRSGGRRYRSNSLRISAIGLKFGGMMHRSKKQIAIYNGRARPNCAFHGTLKFYMVTLGHEEEIEEIWIFLDAVHHEADHCMKWPHSANVRICWSRPAEGVVVPRTLCSLMNDTSTKEEIFTDVIPSHHFYGAGIVEIIYRGRQNHVYPTCWPLSISTFCLILPSHWHWCFFGFKNLLSRCHKFKLLIIETILI